MKGSIATYAAFTVVICVGLWLSVGHAQTGAIELSAAAKQAIAELFPGGQVGRIELERRIVELYEVSLSVDGVKHEVTLTDDGIILVTEEAIDAAMAPQAVNEAIYKLAGDTELKEFERIEVHAELGAVLLQQSRVEYEAEFDKDGKEQIVRLSAEGKSVDDAEDGGNDDEED